MPHSPFHPYNPAVPWPWRQPAASWGNAPSLFTLHPSTTTSACARWRLLDGICTVTSGHNCVYAVGGIRWAKWRIVCRFMTMHVSFHPWASDLEAFCAQLITCGVLQIGSASKPFKLQFHHFEAVVVLDLSSAFYLPGIQGISVGKDIMKVSSLCDWVQCTGSPQVHKTWAHTCNCSAALAAADFNYWPDIDPGLDSGFLSMNFIITVILLGLACVGWGGCSFLTICIFSLVAVKPCSSALSSTRANRVSAVSLFQVVLSRLLPVPHSFAGWAKVI